MQPKSAVCLSVNALLTALSNCWLNVYDRFKHDYYYKIKIYWYHCNATALLLSIHIFGDKYDIRLVKSLIKNDGISKRGSQELKIKTTRLR